jgi:hypothetical protein
MGRNYRESCPDLFKELNILPLKSQYIPSLMMFVIKTTKNILLRIMIVMDYTQDTILTDICRRSV